MQQRRIGAHLSVGKGLVAAAQHMMSMGGNALQIFSGSPRGWARKPLEEQKAADYKKFCQDHDFGPTVVHALYLVNLASEREDLLQHSIEGIIYDLNYVSQIGGVGVVVHLGSHLGNGFEKVFAGLVQRLGKILDATPPNSTLLIENSAGQEGKLCSKLEEIKQLFDALPTYRKQGRLGWCLDTCHAFCAGYRLESLDTEITNYDLWDGLKVIHMNDSRDNFDSGRDRHENIGEGTIGKQTIQAFVRNPKFAHVPLILEVPGFDGTGPDAKNVEIVKSFL